MQRLEVSGAVRPIYGSLGVKRLISFKDTLYNHVLRKMLSPLCLPPVHTFVIPHKSRQTLLAPSIPLSVELRHG